MLLKPVHLIIAFVILCTTYAKAQDTTNKELSIVIAPLVFNEQTNYTLMYRHAVPNNFELRGGVGLYLNTRQEIRNDTQSYSAGKVAYTLSVGIQKNLDPGFDPNLKLYFGLDVYLNSEFRKEVEDILYSYYYNLGAMPLLGIMYPVGNIRLSLECRSDFNANFQDYDAAGSNYDRNFRFRTIDHFSLGLGYLF